MTIDNIKKELVHIIATMFQNYGMDADLIEHMDLIDDFGMDSIMFISMTMEIENHFEIIVPDEMLLMENFNSIDSITTIIGEAIRVKEGKGVVPTNGES